MSHNFSGAYDTPKMQICPICKTEKPYYNSKQKYCRECAKERIKTQRYAHTRMWKSKQRKKVKAIPEKINTIDDIVKIAMRLGISYGKAVRLLEG